MAMAKRVASGAEVAFYATLAVAGYVWLVSLVFQS